MWPLYNLVLFLLPYNIETKENMKSATFLARYYYIIYHAKPYGSWFWHVHCMLRHFFAVFSEPGKYILQYFIDIPIKLGCKSDLNVWPYFLMLVALLTSSCFLLCKFPWFLFFYVCPYFLMLLIYCCLVKFSFTPSF